MDFSCYISLKSQKIYHHAGQRYNTNNNISSVIPEVGSGEGSVYTDLTLPLEGGEAVSKGRDGVFN